MSEGDRIRSVQGYFDQKTFVEQLGLQAIVVPSSVGPFTFGYSVRMQTGKRTKPGAVSLTWIDVRSDEEEREVRERGLQVVANQMAQIPGFIGWVSPVVGRRLFTATAWEDPESAAQLLRSGPYKEAVDRVLRTDFGAAVFTSVWVPHYLNVMWVRCTACGRLEPYRDRRRASYVSQATAACS